MGPSPTVKNYPDNFFYSSSYLTKGGYCYSKGNSFYGESLAGSYFIRVGILKAYYYRTCDFQGVASIPCAQTPSGFALNRDPLRRYISLK